jgi:8-oxo-dGTP diphosphatase
MNSQSREQTDFIVLGVVLNKEGKVMIVKRKKKEITLTKKELIWVFPGGKLEKSETREERVVKEVLDETGYKVKPLKLIHLRIHPETLKIIAYFLCELEEENPIQEIKEKEEIEEVRWVNPEELKNYFNTEIDSEVKKILKI